MLAGKGEVLRTQKYDFILNSTAKGLYRWPITVTWPRCKGGAKPRAKTVGPHVSGGNIIEEVIIATHHEGARGMKK